MSNRTLLLVAGAVALLAAAQTARPTRANSEADLKTEFRQLQERVAELEERIARLEKRPAVVAVPGTARPPHGGTVPENWIQREFNGMQYWIVPLDQARATQPRPSPPPQVLK